MRKLKNGDHIRVISPSSSIAKIGGLEANQAAIDRLKKLGFELSFSEHYFEDDMVHSASIKSRVDDIHKAYLDDSVDAIMATIGGFNSNELLPYLDYDLISKHPKILCGYSDTTALLTAIYTKTGQYTYMGPSFSSFKMNDLQEYQSTAWLEAMTKSHYKIFPSLIYGSNPWYLPDAELSFEKTEWKIYQEGRAEGTLIGGNLSTFGLLRGTPYAPKTNDYILMVEEAKEDDWIEFERNLASILQAYPKPKALLIGRFPKECQMSEELLHFILDKHPILKVIPVLYDLDFAHTQPLFTVTIGAQITVDTKVLELEIKEN